MHWLQGISKSCKFIPFVFPISSTFFPERNWKKLHVHKKTVSSMQSLSGGSNRLPPENTPTLNLNCLLLSICILSHAASLYFDQPCTAHHRILTNPVHHIILTHPVDHIISTHPVHQRSMLIRLPIISLADQIDVSLWLSKFPRGCAVSILYVCRRRRYTVDQSLDAN